MALALILLGPEKFPETGRAGGKAMREFRSMTSDISRDLNSSFDEPPAARRVPTNTVEHNAPETDGMPVDTPSTETGEVKQPDENEPGPL